MKCTIRRVPAALVQAPELFALSTRVQFNLIAADESKTTEQS